MKYSIRVGRHSSEVEATLLPDGSIVVAHEGRTYAVALQQIGASPIYSMLVDGQAHEVFAQGEQGGWLVGVGTELFETRARAGALTALDRDEAESTDGERTIVAPMTGVVTVIRCEAGQAVQKGDILLVLEAMKMNNEIRAPRTATVRSVLVTTGQRVDQRTGLVVLV